MRSINYTLTDAKLKALKPLAGKPRKVADGGGLFVRISAGGTKAWGYAYAYKGKPKEVGLGTFPEVGIKAPATCTPPPVPPSRLASIRQRRSGSRNAATAKAKTT